MEDLIVDEEVLVTVSHAGYVKRTSLSLYRSQHELVYVFKVGTAPHINNVELGRHGRTRSNVWRYAGVNSFGTERDEALAMHPTVKPVRLVADAILDCSRHGDRVLDGFAGSGTTLLAAERTGRIGYGLEIEPRYVDAAIRRLAEHAGLEASHVERLARRHLRQRRQRIARLDVPALTNARALHDPLVGRIHPLANLRIRDATAGHMMARTEDSGSPTHRGSVRPAHCSR